MSEPLFEQLRADLAHAIDTEWHHLGHAITSHLHHPATIDTSASSVPKETPVDLAQLEADIRNDVQAVESKASEVYDHAKTVLEQHLPQVAQLAQKAAASPLVDAALNAVHLSPDLLTAFASAITKADAELGQQQEATAAATAAQAAESDSAAPETPAEPDAPAEVPSAASGQPAVSGAAT